MTRAKPEQALQIAVAAFLRVALRPPTIWTAFPAGGGGKVRGAFLKAMGLQAGWPDLLVISPHYNGVHRTTPLILGLELKSATGRESRAQQAICRAFEDLGCGYATCRSVDDVEYVLTNFGIPLHATVSAMPG